MPIHLRAYRAAKQTDGYNQATFSLYLFEDTFYSSQGSTLNQNRLTCL